MSHLKLLAATAAITIALAGCSDTQSKPAATTANSSSQPSIDTEAAATATRTTPSVANAKEKQVKSIQKTQVDSLTKGMPTDTRLWLHTGTTKPATFPLPGNSRVTVKIFCHASDLQIQVTGEKKTAAPCSPDGGLTLVLPAIGSKARTLTITPSAHDSVWSAAAWRGILTT